MDRRQERDPLDAPFMPSVQAQCRPAPVPCAGLRSGQLHACPCPARAGQSLTTLREKFVKIDAKVVRHGRYAVFQLAEVAVPRALLEKILHSGSTASGHSHCQSRHEGGSRNVPQAHGTRVPKFPADSPFFAAACRFRAAMVPFIPSRGEACPTWVP